MKKRVCLSEEKMGRSRSYSEFWLGGDNKKYQENRMYLEGGGSSEGEAELRLYLSGKHLPVAPPVPAHIGTSVTDHHCFLLSSLPVSSLAPYSPSLHEAL